MSTKRRAQEENVKIKQVLPLMKALGYTNDDEYDFEHNVNNRRADIGVLIDENLTTIVEVKDAAEDLDNHINQAIDYGSAKQLEFVALTNGKEFRVYATFAKGVVNAKDRAVISVKVDDPTKPPPALLKAFSRDEILDLKVLRSLKEKLRPRVTEEDLIYVLTKSTDELYDLLVAQFATRYKNDRNFKNKLNSWALTVKLDIQDKALISKLCKEGAYSLINRVLFYRISEDRSDAKPLITENTLREWRAVVEKPSKKLRELFKNASKEYETFYNSPLFNSITFEDVDWEETVVMKVLSRFANVDFSVVNDDMLGKAYERHIPNDERKRLGQFYTPDFVVDYLLDLMDFKKSSKLLDPSCGSGAFLHQAVRRFKDDTSVNSADIIENNIYGIDINPFACQLTTMNLLLSTLDSKKKPKKINILTADSLLDKKIAGAELFDNGEFGPESKRNVKALSTYLEHSGQFDIIVGNPPYRCFGLRSNKALKNVYQDYVRRRWSGSAEYKISYYPLFIERSIDLLKPGGRLAFILPDSFLVGMYFSKVRRKILDTCKIVEIVLCQKNFWEDAEVGFPTMIVLEREEVDLKRRNHKVQVKFAASENNIKSRKFVSAKYVQDTFEHLDRNRFELYFTDTSKDFITKIRSKTQLTMKSVVTGHTGIRAKGGIGKENLISDKQINSKYVKSLHSGSEVLPYKVEYNGGWTMLDKKLLCSGGWDPEVVEQRKIFVRQTGDSLISAIDGKRYYHLNNVHSFSPNNPDVPLEWVSLMLNSQVMNRFYHIISMEVGRAMAQIDIDTVHLLPYIEPTDEQLAEALELYSALSKAKPDSKEFKVLRAEANELIASAFGLSAKLRNYAEKSVEEKKLAA